MINLNDIKTEKVSNFSIEYSNSVCNIIITNKVDDLLVFHSDLSTQLNIKVEALGSAEMVIIYDENVDEKEIEENIEVRGNLRLIKFYKNKFNKVKNTLKCNVLDVGKYDEIVLDFSKGNIYLSNNITTQIGNSATLNCASIVDEKYIKNIVNSLTNLGHNSSCYMDNYGVSFDNGIITINGIGTIEKGGYKSSNIQKATMFVMDPNSRATSKPYLCIDEDDVVASHANAVGQVSEETIYYLCSRGIKKEAAQKMVVLGYFKKFIEMINSKELQNEINEFISEVIINV